MLYRLACLGSTFWSLGVAGCAGGLKNETDCSFGGCCASVEATNSWILSLRSRTGLPASLISQIADVSPVGATLGIANLLTSPLSANSLLHQPQQLFLQLRVLRIYSIDQKKQSFHMKYATVWTWRDCRLLFNCTDALEVNGDAAAFDKLWFPRYHIFEKEEEEFHMRSRSHTIRGHGVDSYVEEHVSTFHCPFNFEELPFDEQTCKLSFSLPGWPAAMMKLAWAPTRPVTSSKLSASEWEITQGEDWIVTARNASKHSPDLLAPDEQLIMSEIYAELKFERKPGFLNQQFCVPIVLFYIISYLGLWLSTAAVPARVAAAVIPALAVSNKMNSLASILPPISTSTRLNSFLDLAFWLVVVHSVEYGIVHFAEKRAKAIAESTKKVVPLDAELKPPIPTRGEQVWILLSRYLEIAMRILSPLIFLLVGLLILYA